jgi:hypothetical protein
MHSTLAAKPASPVKNAKQETKKGKKNDKEGNKSFLPSLFFLPFLFPSCTGRKKNWQAWRVFSPDSVSCG